MHRVSPWEMGSRRWRTKSWRGCRTEERYKPSPRGQSTLAIESGAKEPRHTRDIRTADRSPKICDGRRLYRVPVRTRVLNPACRDRLSSHLCATVDARRNQPPRRNHRCKWHDMTNDDNLHSHITALVSALSERPP